MNKTNEKFKEIETKLEQCQKMIDNIKKNHLKIKQIIEKEQIKRFKNIYN